MRWLIGYNGSELAPFNRRLVGNGASLLLGVCVFSVANENINNHNLNNQIK